MISLDIASLVIGSLIGRTLGSTWCKGRGGRDTRLDGMALRVLDDKVDFGIFLFSVYYFITSFPHECTKQISVFLAKQSKVFRKQRKVSPLPKHPITRSAPPQTEKLPVHRSRQISARGH